MINEENTIKSIIPTTCPHCRENILVEFNFSIPRLDSVYTTGDIERAKQSAVSRIKELDIPEESKIGFISWIESEDTVFGFSEVDNIVENAQKSNEDITTNQNK